MSIRRKWIDDHADYPHKDWCLIWPFSRASTGYAQIEGAERGVHRIMCERRHGPPPSSEHHAAHSCHRGHEACVNPHHLDWKTPSENQIDRRNRGWEPQCKLTVEQALEIRDLKGLENPSDTAERFKVSESNVRKIQAGKTWSKERHIKRPLTADQILKIKSMPRGIGVVPGLAKEFGISATTIHRIRNGKSYNHGRPSEDCANV